MKASRPHHGGHQETDTEGLRYLEEVTRRMETKIVQARMNLFQQNEHTK